MVSHDCSGMSVWEGRHRRHPEAPARHAVSIAAAVSALRRRGWEAYFNRCDAAEQRVQLAVNRREIRRVRAAGLRRRARPNVAVELVSQLVHRGPATRNMFSSPPSRRRRDIRASTRVVPPPCGCTMRLLQEADARRRRLVDLADEAVDIDACAPAAGGRARALTTDTLQLALLCGRTARPSGPAWQFPPPTVRMRAGHARTWAPCPRTSCLTESWRASCCCSTRLRRTTIASCLTNGGACRSTHERASGSASARARRAERGPPRQPPPAAASIAPSRLAPKTC